MYISQFYILSPRGDKLVFKDYRHDVTKTSDEIFFRKYKFWDGKGHQSPAGDCPPVFLENGIHFFHIVKSGLIFVITSLRNVSPSYMIEVIDRIIKMTRDYLGVLSEESVRKNFTLMYELLDETVDSGVVQELTTEKTRPYMFNEVIQVSPEDTSSSLIPRGGIIDRIKRGEFTERSKRSVASQFSVIQNGKNRKNEIYIDVLERLNVTFNGLGNVINSEVDGSIIMKSFLSGSPDLFLGLNEDLVVGRSNNSNKYATVILDSVNFHEEADYTNFERDRIIRIRPPNGEFTIMNYRTTGEIPQPFRIIPSIEVQSSYKAELTLRVRANFAATSTALAVSLSIPVPRCTTSLGVEYGAGASGQSHEYNTNDKTVSWRLAKFHGSTEQLVKIRFSTSIPITPSVRKEVGPIYMGFEIPMHTVSGICIRSLRLEEMARSYNPQRWVRNITQANSYVCRMH